jgi:hypothetical protein
MVMVSAIGVALVALLAGWVLDRNTTHARWLYVLAGLLGLLAAWRYRAVRVRREFRLLAAEAGEGQAGSAFSLEMLRQILRADPEFRRYMFWMSMYGSGNLMISGQLVVLFTDRLGMPGITQIMALTVVPLLMPLCYRRRGCSTRAHQKVPRASAGYGCRHDRDGAAVIGRTVAGLGRCSADRLHGRRQPRLNLGHNDFAPLGRAAYMGVHAHRRAGPAGSAGRDALLRAARALAYGSRRIRTADPARHADFRSLWFRGDARGPSRRVCRLSFTALGSL